MNVGERAEQKPNFTSTESFSWWIRAKQSLQKPRLKPFLWASLQVRTVLKGWGDKVEKADVLTSGWEPRRRLASDKLGLNFCKCGLCSHPLPPPRAVSLCEHLAQNLLFCVVCSSRCMARLLPTVSGSFGPKPRGEGRRWPGPWPAPPAAALAESCRSCVPTYFYIFRSQINARDSFID